MRHLTKRIEIKVIVLLLTAFMVNSGIAVGANGKEIKRILWLIINNILHPGISRWVINQSLERYCYEKSWSCCGC